MASNVERIYTVYEMKIFMERKNTHANKAKSYDIGRPNYPEAFFKY